MMYKNGKEVSDTSIRKTPELAYYTKEGKILCAFKDSRLQFEKLVEEARKNGSLPENPLLLELLQNESSGAEEDGDVEIDIKKGTEADGLHQFQQTLPFKTDSLEKFLLILQDLEDNRQGLTFDSLKAKMKDNKDWMQAFEDQTDINFSKFLQSSLFIPNKKSKTRAIRKDRLKLFAIFSCKEVD